MNLTKILKKQFGEKNDRTWSNNWIWIKRWKNHE
jgi:hypothetical protein